MMKLVDKILTLVFAALVLTCLVLEFVTVDPMAKKIVLGVTAFYALGCLVYFVLEKPTTKAIK